MSTTESGHQHHHHHHHHKKDGASIFKARSLAAIERRKLIAKWLYRLLVAIAIILVIVIFVLMLLGD